MLYLFLLIFQASIAITYGGYHNDIPTHGQQKDDSPSEFFRQFQDWYQNREGMVATNRQNDPSTLSHHSNMSNSFAKSAPLVRLHTVPNTITPSNMHQHNLSNQPTLSRLPSTSSLPTWSNPSDQFMASNYGPYVSGAPTHYSHNFSTMASHNSSTGLNQSAPYTMSDPPLPSNPSIMSNQIVPSNLSTKSNLANTSNPFAISGPLVILSPSKPSNVSDQIASSEMSNPHGQSNMSTPFSKIDPLSKWPSLSNRNTQPPSRTVSDPNVIYSRNNLPNQRIQSNTNMTFDPSTSHSKFSSTSYNDFNIPNKSVLSNFPSHPNTSDPILLSRTDRTFSDSHLLANLSNKFKAKDEQHENLKTKIEIGEQEALYFIKLFYQILWINQGGFQKTHPLLHLNNVIYPQIVQKLDEKRYEIGENMRVFNGKIQTFCNHIGMAKNEQNDRMGRVGNAQERIIGRNLCQLGILFSTAEYINKFFKMAIEPHLFNTMSKAWNVAKKALTDSQQSVEFGQNYRVQNEKIKGQLLELKQEEFMEFVKKHIQLKPTYH